jgi:capsular exopolysaccharide synthesis family protein
MNALDRYRRAGTSDELVTVEVEPIPPEADDRIDMRKLLAVFRRRLRLFIAVVAAMVLAAVVMTAKQTPTYQAVSSVAINTREARVAPEENSSVLAPLPDSSAAVDTEVQVISSRGLAQRVVSDLNLQNDAEFNPVLRMREKAAHPSLLDRLLQRKPAPAPAGPADSPEVRQAIVDRLLGGLSVSRVGVTYVISIGYSSSDPVKAARIANSFAKQYVQSQLDAKLSASRQANGFLSERIEELRRQALEDAAKVQQYRIANGLLSTSGASLTEQEISAYNQQVAAARVEAAADQARLQTARQQLANGSSGEDVGEALGSGVVGALRAQRAGISVQVAQMEERYGPRYPGLIKSKRELADIDAQIQAEINRVISNLEAKAKVSERRLASISGSLGSARGALTENNRAMVGLAELEQKAAASQALYESYLNKFKQTGAQEGTEQPDSRLLSEARIPTFPSSPNIMLNVALGLVLGLGLGLAAVFVSEMLDSSLTTAEDVERRLGRRYLAGIPEVGSIGGIRNVSPVDAVVRYPTSVFAEAFRNLRASLLYGTARGPVKIVAMASALPQEGKSTTSICLARSAASMGQRVILLDCDLRRRQLNRFIQPGSTSVGLLDVLAGRATLEEACCEDPVTQAVMLPLNTTEVAEEDPFGGEAMDALLERLRDSFDLIILDTAPILAIADTRVLATKADVVVLLARWRKTSEHALRAAIKLLPSDVRIAGVALNQIHIGKQTKFGFGDPAYYFKKYKAYYS